VWVNFLRVIVFSLVGLAVLFGGVFLFSPKVNYQNPERLRPLGTEPFDPARWAASDAEQRGTMVYDFVRQRRFEAKEPREIVELLGAPTARYLNANNLAYRVGTSAVKSRFGERFTFALIWNEHTKRFDRFWIEPFPEEALRK
jgi:hypothetical protein